MKGIAKVTHPLKDAPKPTNRAPHPSDWWKGDIHQEIAKLPNRHRGDKFVIRENSLQYLTPLHDRVLVKRKISAAGIIALTDAANTLDAEIIALGRKCRFGHQVGQLVRLSPSVNEDYSDLMEDGEHYLIVQEADILGILEYFPGHGRMVISIDLAHGFRKKRKNGRHSRQRK